ncbi:MAG TPA: O-antigen ligase family protein, partial [Chitinophagales bacterium]
MLKTISQRNLTIGLYSFSALCLALYFVGLKTGFPLLGFAPVGLGLIVWGIADYKSLFFLLWITIPLSVEFYLPNGFGTDLPTEPLMLGLSVITIILLVTRHQQFPWAILKKPLFILLFAHLLWILICAINSDMAVFSYKIFAAKIWYVLPFTILPLFVIRTEDDLKKLFWSIYIPLTFTVVLSLLRHGILYHFSFDNVHQSIQPYYRNHVSYATIMSVFFPFLWLADKWYEKGSQKYKLLQFSKLLYLVAIYFSYTRGAMLAVFAMIPFYVIIKWNLIKTTLITAIIGSALVVTFLVHNNYFFRYAPTYKRTVMHEKFNDHFASTFEGEDLSSMERVYRWVAAVKMIPERPYMGVGSGNFYNYYKRYTATDFYTYVSDNPERSTVHNYFLFITIEQGFIGLAIFVLLT